MHPSLAQSDRARVAYAPISVATDATTPVGAVITDSTTLSATFDRVVVVAEELPSDLVGSDSGEWLFFAFLRFFNRPTSRVNE